MIYPPPNAALTARRLLRLCVCLLLIGGGSSARAQPAWRAAADSSNAYWAQRNYEKAYEKGLRAALMPKPAPPADSLWTAVYKIAEQLPDSVAVATALKAGTYYFAQNENDRARTWLAGAVSRADSLRLRRYQHQSRIMLAKIDGRNQAFDRAVSLYKWILSDTTAAAECPACQLEAMLGLSGIYMNTQRADSANYLTQKALGMILRLPNYRKNRLYPLVKLQLAAFALLANDLTTALRESEESYLTAKAIMPNDPLIIGIAYQYAYVQADINDEKAMEATRMARRVLNQQPNYRRHPYYLYLFSNEIGLLRVLGRNAEAALLADSLLQRHSLDELLTFAGADNLLSRITRTYIGEKRDADLEKIAQKAQTLLTSELQTPGVNPSYMYSLLGKYHQYKRSYTEAVRCLNEEWRLDSLAYGDSQFNYSLMNQIAECQAKAGQRTDSYVSFGRLVAEYEQNIRTNLWLMSDAERDNYLQTTTIAGIFWHLLRRTDPLPQEIELAYTYKLLKQGVRLNMSRSINRFTNAQSQGTAGLPAIRQLMQIRIRLTDSRLDDQPVERRQLQQIADSLERSMGGEAITLNQTLAPVRWQDVRARLKPGEAAVEMVYYTNYSRGEALADSGAYAAFLIRPEWPVPKLIALPDPGNVKKYITSEEAVRMRSAEHYRYVVFSAGNQKDVFEQVWQPIATALGPVSRLYMALDGGYHLLNPYTIRNPRTKRYLADELEIILLNSTQDIRATPRQPVNQTAVLVGNPAYSLNRLPAPKRPAVARRSRPVRLRNGLTFDELPYTEIEVKQLGKLFRSFQLQPQERLGVSASEGAFQHLKSPRILHVATHGYLRDTTSQTTSGLLLTCGLVLAGAADTTRQKDQTDGLLTGYEASLLNLHDTELVTLSACESGTGDYSEGEGINGLQRAFLLAGAQSVLVSLWKVNDQLTQQLMADFYRYWLGGLSKPAALRKAQGNLRKQYPNPYDWGGFVLLGQ